MTLISKKVSEFLKNNNFMLVSAESCTGGWVAKTMTDLPGSSHVFERGFVTYSNQAKREMLGVLSKTLDKFGAVSEQVVAEMTEGALKHSPADVAVAISGIAGPQGGTKQKPVGTVCFAWQLRGKPARVETRLFSGDRDSIRAQSVDYCLNGILEKINGQDVK